MTGSKKPVKKKVTKKPVKELADKKKSTRKPTKRPTGVNGIGRPTKYNPKVHVSDIYELKKECYSDKEICKMWGIAISTICVWKKDFKEFSESHQRGVEASLGTLRDAARTSLYRAVSGYEYQEVKKIERVHPVLSPLKPIVYEITTCTKRVQPSVTAIAIVLNNLDSDNFQRNPEPSTGMGVDIIDAKYTRIEDG